VNQLILTAHIHERKALRYTPAGLPVADVVLEHVQEQLVSGGIRKTDMRLSAKATGLLAERIQQTDLTQDYRFTGFLTQARLGKGLIFEITQFESQ
jgi:primosomal replication protein N